LDITLLSETNREYFSLPTQRWTHTGEKLELGEELN